MTQLAPRHLTPDTPTAVVSIGPIRLSAPSRPVDVQLRVSAPVVGAPLPIVLLSHGHGPSNFLSSLYGYGPLATYYASHGFAVIQPTHLDSKALGLREADHPEAPLYWRSRAEDMSLVLDQIDVIERAAGAIAGRLDHDRVAVVGHSMGGHTASVLLGARPTDPHVGTELDLADPRIKAGVLLAAPGRGGGALTDHAARHYPILRAIDFSTMTAPTLVVVGEDDSSPHLTVDGPTWSADPYRLAPSPKSLLTLFGGEHGLGGVSGYDAAETTDEDPRRVMAVQRLTTAYLRSQLDPVDPAWPDASAELAAAADPPGRLDSK